MNKKIQKIMSVTMAVSMLALMSGGGALADVQTINENTGFSSVNDVSVTVSDDFASVNQNLETFVNVGAGSVSSGGNIVEQNTSDGEVISGIVDVSGEFSNDANINSLTYLGSWLTGDDPFASNSTTGADSTNNASVDASQTTTAVNANDVDAANTIDVDGITGNNAVSGNTGAGTVDTGGVDALLGTTNTLNNNFLEILSELGAPESSALNDTTGADSENNAEVFVDSTITAANTNQADILNTIAALLSSGGNTIEDNTGPADLATGDVEAEAEIVNNANSNETTISSQLSGSAVFAGNDTTGADSTNNATAAATQDITVVNENLADIANAVDMTATSGGNVIQNNTGSVTASTGGAANTVLVDNGDIFNSNTTTIDLDMGDVTVDASNSTTGADSENNADASLDSSIAVVNTNNAAVANVVDTTSTTGGNTISDNTGSVDLETGDASTDTTITNVLNENTTTIAGSPSVSVSAANSTTGADSTNNASSSASSSISVVNVNEADVTNVVSSTSNSGGNVIDGNTGASSVSTGSASLNFNISNTGNSNTTEVGD